MKTVPLGDVAVLVRGVSFSKDEGELTPSVGRLPVIRAGSIQDSLLLREGQIWVPAEKIKEIQKIRVDDIVMCTSSGSSDLVGKCARSEENFEGSFGAFCVGVRPDKEKVSPSYLYHFLCSPLFKAWTSSSSGANIKNIRVSELADFQIPLPPLSEQKRIAAILDKADAIRRKRQQAIQLADDFLRAVFLDMFGDPVANPKGWKVKRFSDLCRQITVGLVIKPASYYVDSGVPAIRSLNIKDKGIDQSNFVYFSSVDNETVLSKSRVFEGDLVMVRSGRPGKTAVVPAGLDGVNAIDVLIVRPDLEVFDSNYLAFFFNSGAAENIVMAEGRGQIQQHLNVGSLSVAEVSVPPLTLQKKFAEILRVVRLKYCPLDFYPEDFLFNSVSQAAFSGDL